VTDAAGSVAQTEGADGVALSGGAAAGAGSG